MKALHSIPYRKGKEPSISSILFKDLRFDGINFLTSADIDNALYSINTFNQSIRNFEITLSGTLNTTSDFYREWNRYEHRQRNRDIVYPVISPIRLTDGM